MVNLGRKRVSRIVWETILENTVSHPKMPLITQANTLDALRTNPATGSVSVATLWCLYSVCQKFRPKRAIEIGTYIGKTTLAMVQSGVEVHTCDASNDIKLPFACVQYPKTTSTDMLTQLEPHFDMMMLDGRLQQADLPHIGRLLHSNGIVALDDFEGTEKGTANAMVFNYDNAHLIYPPEKALLQEHGLPDESTLALILPKRLVRLTNQ